MDENPDNIPLVERVHKAESLVRALNEHLRQALLPKLHDLRAAGKIFDPTEVTDQEILDRIQAVLAAESFATGIYDKLLVFLRSIERESKEVMGVSE